MKLSKRFAAAIIAICVLLMSFSAFAAQFQFPNKQLVLPTDGSSVAITSTGLGHANSSIGIVIDSASAVALGLQLAELPKTTTKTAGTNYDGLMLSGTIKARNLTYVPGATSGTAKNVREMFENNELVQFDFADAYVKSIRANQAGTAVVLEIAYQEYMDRVVPGTAKRLAEGKITGEETESVTFTEDDLYTLTDEECATLKGFDYRSSGAGDFYGASSDGLLATNLTAKAGAAYKTSSTIDTINFPEGTVFISSANLIANGASIKTTTDWMATSSGYSEGYNSYCGTSAPYGDYVSQASGEYYVYALKTAYNTDGSRYAKAIVNDVEFAFHRDHVPSSLPDMVKGWYWEKDETQTLTLNEGGIIAVKVACAGYSYSRLAGLAFVPVEKVAAMEAIENWNDFRDGNRFNQTELSMLHRATAPTYIEGSPVEVTVKVNGTDVVVSSAAAEAVVNVGLADFDGAIISNATVMDAIVAAGVVNAENAATYAKNINVKLNGLTIGEYDKWTLYGGEEITAVINETVDGTNFAPVCLTNVYKNLGGTNTGLKLCLDPAVMLNTSIGFASTGSSFVDAAMTDAKLRGYAVLTSDLSTTLNDEAAVISKGSKVYFNNSFNGVVVTSGTHGLEYLGVKFYTPTTDATIEMPDGTAGHHPYKIKQSVYNFNKAFITNSSTTDVVKARYLEHNGKWQLYTDGYRKVNIFKLTKENGYNKVTEIVEAEVVVGAPYSFKLAEGEKVFVWASSIYDGTNAGGTAMIPLTVIE